MSKRALEQIVIALLVVVAEGLLVNADAADFGGVVGLDTNYKLELVSFENLAYPNRTWRVSGLMTSSTR